MAYNSLIPAASDRLSVSQGDIQANFAAIKTLVEVNHETFGSANEGKHKFLQLPEQGAAPTTAANEGALYSAVGATSTVTELVFRRESNGTAIAFTEGSLGASFADSWSRFPSGMVMKFGRGTGSASYTINLDGIGPAFTAVYSAQITPESAVTHNVSALTTASMSVTLGSSGTMYWCVIGK